MTIKQPCNILRTHLFVGLATLAWLLPTSAPALAPDPVEVTDGFVEEYIRHELLPLVHERYPDDDVTLTVRDVSQAVLGKPCLQPALQLQGQHLFGDLAIKLRCGGQAPWSFFVRVHVDARTNIVTTRTNIARGQAIGPKDVVLRKTSRHQLRQHHLTDAQSVIGFTARRAIASDRPLQTHLLQAPLAVKRGERVTLRAERGAVAINSVGIALKDAAVGQSIRVRNQQSKRIVQGWVWGPGVVGTRRIREP